jgi:hypothetical protein
MGIATYGSMVFSSMKFGFGGTLLITHQKYIKDGKVHVHLGFKSKALPGPLTDLST